MSNIAELRNLNGLNHGIHKHWIWGNEDNFYLSCDYFQKVNYCVQDLNAEIHNLQVPSMKEVIYVIALVDWICEAVDSLHTILKNEVVDYLNLEDDADCKQATKYFKAIRSFVVAHPLNTTRHKAYGMDGDLICVDVRNHTSKLTETCSSSNDWFLLTLNGLKENARDIQSDFILYVYSQRLDKMRYFKYIRANFSDLYYVAELQINRLYALDSRLKNLTKKKVGIQ